MDMTLNLYIDYLICSTSYTTATGLSRLTDKAISHDKVTKFLSSKNYTSADLWKIAKPIYESIKLDNSVLIIDDSIEEKPYTDENELMAWHFNHAKGRAVKGINFITSLYENEKGSLPIGFNLIKKTLTIKNAKTGKIQRKSEISKQQYYRNLIQSAIENTTEFKYILNDIWFASAENMNFIKAINKNFIMPIKSNRKVALSDADKALGIFVGIDSVKPGENILVRIRGVDFPLRFVRQVFKNEDDSTGILYLVSSDIELTNEQITAIYKRRWKVETYHQSLKNNASLAKSPTKIPKTQANHFFASLCAYIRLQSISMLTKYNHFALKTKIYIEALKKAMLELQNLKTSKMLQTDNCVYRLA